MKTLQYQFVNTIPDALEEGMVYISVDYCTVVHKCVCGCGNEVVTPISPTDWQLSFDGESISLSPSIGNWNFECQSHYWIIKNKVKISRQWSSEEIQEGRRRDERKKNIFFARKKKSRRKK